MVAIVRYWDEHGVERVMREGDYANERMRQAAPDMLAALNAILHSIDDGGKPLEQALQMANAAVFKATRGPSCAS